MRDYRTIDDITEEYLRDHPDEIDDYITELFEEYAQDEDTATLLSSLRVIRTYSKTFPPTPPPDPHKGGHYIYYSFPEGSRISS